MQRSDLLLGEFETVVSVYRWDDGELVRMTGHGASPVLAYVPESDEAGRVAQETMALVAHPGVPECRRTIRAGSGAMALVLEGAEDARPLALIHDLPAVTLRAGLTSLLRTLNVVHARGIVHRSIDRSNVLADPSGRFWLIGWGSARPVSADRRPAGSLSEATVDLRDLARAFREALLRRPWPDPQAATIHDRPPRTHAGQDLIDAGVKVDRDFARVLSRLVGSDPREAYSGASDVLVDLSVEDATAFDPWETLRPLGTRREVARVLRLLDDTRRATSETVQHAASVDYVGPAGSGKTRLLSEIARAARSRDVIVLTAEGGARGTWGGVGALARQLVQLLGRDARMCRQHEDALRHLLDDHDPSARPEPQSPPGLGIEGRNTLTAACTAALTDMARIAFRGAPGMLVLDDEDNLPPAARDVWRAAGQFVQAINGEGGVLRALLVSTSTRSYPAEIGAHRVTVELRTWRQRDMEKLLARAFASPGGTRDVSTAIHRITGGRPGDVIGYLRDLERRGALRREGLRWRLEVPLAALPALTGGVAEQVRRALDSCGRDATAMVEVLAVAPDVTLGRSEIAEICGVRGPRLASAADAAVTAGLLVPDGSSWRVRTDAIAHKVYAAIPDDRRKVLHREVLQFLLDTAPAALDPIARHARASSDPRAAAWTEQAITRAREEGRWTIALDHAERLAVEIGPDDANSRLVRAELLASLGRPGDAINVLQSSVTHSPYSPIQHLLATLIVVRARYDAREWNDVVSAGIPETTIAPDLTAEHRYLRAAAMCHLARRDLGAREARLAKAELPTDVSNRVALARLEFEYQSALYSADWRTAKSALLSKLRLGRRAHDWRQTVVDRTKLGNATRFLERNYPRAQSILTRAVGTLRQDGATDIGGTTLSALYGALAYTCLARGALRHAYRHFGRSAYYAAQSGVETLTVAARLRLISCAVECGRATYGDKQYIASFNEYGATSKSHTTLSASIDLAMCLLYYGYQRTLERLAHDLRASVGDDHRTRVVEGLSVVGRMWLMGPACETFAQLLSGKDARGVLRWLARGRLGDLWLSAFVYLALDSARESDKWMQDLVNSGRISRIVTRRRSPGWGVTAAALGLALWIPIRSDPDLWQQLLRIVRRQPGALPVGLEWQRVLMESREAMRVGGYRDAQRLRREALDQLELIAACGDPDGASQARVHWRNLVAATSSASLSKVDAKLSDHIVPHGTSCRERAVSPAQCPIHWAGLIAIVMRASRVVLSSPYSRELELLSCHLHATLRQSVAIVRWDSDKALSWSPCASIAVFLTPETWPTVEALHVAAQLRRDGLSVTQTILMSTLTLGALRTLGPGHAALVEACDGTLLTLPALLSEEPARRDALAEICRGMQPAVEPTPEVIEEVARYHWPGGLAELEMVARAAVLVRESRITGESLRATGWRQRTACHDVLSDTTDCRLLQQLHVGGPASVGELSRSLGQPKRTLLRHATRLAESGMILRSGRGRATRYRANPTGVARG